MEYWFNFEIKKTPVNKNSGKNWLFERFGF
jgi:hypothetical protein